MTVSLREAIDGANLVKFHPYSDASFAVWNGGHTVNFYAMRHFETGMECDPTTCINVGDFETGEVSRSEVIEGIDKVFEDWE